MMHLVMKDSKRRKSILDRDWNEEERKHEAAKIITRILRRHSQNKSREADAFKGRFSAGKQKRKGRFHCPLLKNIFYAGILVLFGGATMSLIEFSSAAQKIEKAKKDFKMVEEYFGHNETILNYIREHAILFDNSTYKNNWYLSGACFYAFTVCTTIGYGNYAPITVGGKVFTVVYGLLSIPLAGALLVSVAQTALDFFAMIYSLSMNKIDAAFDQLDEDGGGFLDREEMRKGLALLDIAISDAKFIELMLVIDKDQDNQIDKEEFKLAIELLDADVSSVSTRGAQTKILVTALVCWLFGGTIFFAFSESWFFYESLYFSIITLLTVGLGDYTPNHTSIGVSLFLYFFVLGGLGMLAVFVNLLKVIIQKKQEEAMKVLLKRREHKEELLIKQTTVDLMINNVRKQSSTVKETNELDCTKDYAEEANESGRKEAGARESKDIKIAVADYTAPRDKETDGLKSPAVTARYNPKTTGTKTRGELDFSLPNRKRRPRRRMSAPPK